MATIRYWSKQEFVSCLKVNNWRRNIDRGDAISVVGDLQGWKDLARRSRKTTGFKASFVHRHSLTASKPQPAHAAYEPTLPKPVDW